MCVLPTGFARTNGDENDDDTTHTTTASKAVAALAPWAVSRCGERAVLACSSTPPVAGTAAASSQAHSRARVRFDRGGGAVRLVGHAAVGGAVVRPGCDPGHRVPRSGRRGSAAFRGEPRLAGPPAGGSSLGPLLGGLSGGGTRTSCRLPPPRPLRGGGVDRRGSMPALAPGGQPKASKPAPSVKISSLVIGHTAQEGRLTSSILHVDAVGRRAVGLPEFPVLRAVWAVRVRGVRRGFWRCGRSGPAAS